MVTLQDKMFCQRYDVNHDIYKCHGRHSTAAKKRTYLSRINGFDFPFNRWIMGALEFGHR